MSDAKKREAICTIGASIFERGLTAGSSGNISLRITDGWLMTPTNASLGRLDPARLSKLDAAGRLVSGDPPTKESFLHRVMYEERDGTGAVVHLHSTHSVAVSCLAETDPDDVLPPITAYYVMRVGQTAARPLFPARRPGFGGGGARVCRQAPCGIARQSRTGRRRRQPRRRGQRARGIGRNREAIPAAAGRQDPLADPAQVEKLGE